MSYCSNPNPSTRENADEFRKLGKDLIFVIGDGPSVEGVGLRALTDSTGHDTAIAAPGVPVVDGPCGDLPLSDHVRRVPTANLSLRTQAGVQLLLPHPAKCTSLRQPEAGGVA